MFKVYCPECHAFITFLLIALAGTTGKADFSCKACGHQWALGWEKDGRIDEDAEVTIKPLVPLEQSKMF